MVVSMSTATHYLSDGITSRPVTDSVLRIGRGDECEIRLADRSVSRQHCMIFLQGQSLMLRDLNSSNGTYVNGNRIALAIAYLLSDLVAMALHLARLLQISSRIN